MLTATGGGPVIPGKDRARFARYASAEAIEHYLAAARSEQARINRYVDWLVGLAERRATERAAARPAVTALPDRTRADTSTAVALYSAAGNGYDLAKDPRCLWGWGPPVCDHMFGHFCCRPYRHEGRCWDGGELPDPDDPACAASQRPANWDDQGRAEANA